MHTAEAVRQPTPTNYVCAQRAIAKLADGTPIDRACKKAHPEFTKRHFRAQLRKHQDLHDAYEQAKADYLRNEMDDMINLADSGTLMDKDELAALKLRIDTRKFFAERLLREYQPKMKSEISGAVSLIVETGVPRVEIEATDAEIVEGDINDLL